MDNSNTIVPLNKRNLNNTMKSSLILKTKRNRVLIKKVSLEYSDNIMKLNNLEKRNVSFLRGITHNSNNLNPLKGEMYYR